MNKYFKKVQDLMSEVSPGRILELYNILTDHSEFDIYIIGNGGSQATASHFACDLSKLGYRAFDLSSTPILTAEANDSGYENAYLNQLIPLMKSWNSILIAISGTGNSKNVVKAVKYAKGCEAITVALTGFDGGKLSPLVDLDINVPGTNIRQVEDVHLIICHNVIEYIKNGSS